MRRNYFDLFRYVRFRELVQVWKLPVAAAAAVFYRRRHRNLWIVSEDPYEARDNGFWFFEFVRKNHPGQECVYAIRKSSPDYRKTAGLGMTVEYGSLRHWIAYLSSSVQISSQKSGDPNAAIFYFLQVYGFLKNKRVFLQHGITVSDLDWLHYPSTRISRFLCGCLPEYQYIRERYGYPDDHVRYTGMCRFDGLHTFTVDPSLVLIMPSWRNWLTIRKDRLRRVEGTNDLARSEYFIRWREFLEDPTLKKIADECHVRFLFYPHRNMQQYLSMFPSGLEHIEICDRERCDVQELLKRAALLVTDYSSVFFDMVYMKKPVIFYQFDYEKFRRWQYPEGYFDYRDNPFGKSCRNREEVFMLLRRATEQRYAISCEYAEAHAQFFPLYDRENTARTYEAVKELSTERRRE